MANEHPDRDELDTVPTDLQALHHQLQADSADWSRHVPSSERLTSYYQTLLSQQPGDLVRASSDSRRSLQPPLRSERGYMHTTQKRLSGIFAVVMVVALVATTIVLFQHHPGKSGNSAAATPTLVPTATPAPVVSFTPSTVTAHGFTIQLDTVDANALRIAIRYHIINKPSEPGSDYSTDYPFIRDENGTYHYVVSGGVSYDYPNLPNSTYPAYENVTLAPMAPGLVTNHTLTLTFLSVDYVDRAGDPAVVTSGPWNFTIHLVPAVSGWKALSQPGQTANGVMITPQAVAWIDGADPYASQAVTLQLAMSGLPKVSDPTNHPVGFNMVQFYKHKDIPLGDNGLPVTHAPNQPPVASRVTLTLSNGQVEKIPAYVSIAGNRFDQSEMTIIGGSIETDGTVLVDVAFQHVILKSGDQITLYISNLVVGVNTTISGPWSFNMTV